MNALRDNRELGIPIDLLNYKFGAGLCWGLIVLIRAILDRAQKKKEIPKR